MGLNPAGSGARDCGMCTARWRNCPLGFGSDAGTAERLELVASRRQLRAPLSPLGASDRDPGLLHYIALLLVPVGLPDTSLTVWSMACRFSCIASRP